jgi:hypothetical protein
MKFRKCLLLLFVLAFVATLSAQDTRSYKIFQFPADKIPRVDGNKEDWDIVPDDFVVATDQLVNDNNKTMRPDPKNLDVKVKVGWVKGLNRLYWSHNAS